MLRKSSRWLTPEIVAIMVGVTLFVLSPAQAMTWTEGHHEIVDGDVYGEVYIFNDVTLDILGGDIARLAANDNTYTNWYDGEMNTLWARDDSIVNIYGGTLDILGVTENSLVSLYGGNLNRLGITNNGLLNLYAYDVICHPEGGLYDRGWLEGRYISSDLYFNIDFVELGTCSHINIVPEPSTLLLLGLGGLLLRRRK